MKTQPRSGSEGPPELWLPRGALPQGRLGLVGGVLPAPVRSQCPTAHRTALPKEAPGPRGHGCCCRGGVIPDPNLELPAPTQKPPEFSVV